MSLQVNEWTRIHDDKCQYNYENNARQRPLRYITNNRTEFKPNDELSELGYYTTSTHTTPSQINDSSKLRPEMTNLNEVQSLETRQFPTVPFMGSGEFVGSTEDYVDINSELRGNATRLTVSDKAEVVNYTPGFLPNNAQKGALLPTDWTHGGRSSRNDMRELYKDVC